METLGVPPHLAVQAGGQGFIYPLLPHIVTSNNDEGVGFVGDQVPDQFLSLLDDILEGGEVVLRPAVGGVQVEQVQLEVRPPELWERLQAWVSSEVPRVKVSVTGVFDEEHQAARTMIGIQGGHLTLSQLTGLPWVRWVRTTRSVLSVGL